jgi:hypothetical protein
MRHARGFIDCPWELEEFEESVQGGMQGGEMELREAWRTPRVCCVCVFVVCGGRRLAQVLAVSDGSGD